MDLNTIEKRKNIVKKLRGILILIILIPIVTFWMYPMINMSPRDIHVGIVNLDRGAEFDQGKVNLGDKVVSKITEPDTDEDADEESPVVWEVYATEDDAKAAMENKDIYGYLIIPSNFSKKQTQTLTAFNDLSTALGNMSEGTGKMSDGIDAAGSKLSQMPKAFNNLSKVTSKLGEAAGGLQDLTDLIDAESAKIKDAVSDLSSDNQTVQEKIAEAQAALEGDEPDIDAAKAALADAKAANESSAESISQSSATINQNASAISAQSQNMKKALSGIEKAENGMSSKFKKMAGKMSGMSNIKQLSAALGELSEGLGEISDNMDENVSDAIDTLNGDAETDESDTVKLKFYLDQSRHVLVSNTLVSMMNGLSANSGMQVETKYVNEIPDELSNFYFAMVFVMITMFTSMIPGILTGISFRSREEKKNGIMPKQAVKKLLAQLCIILSIAVCIGFLVPRVVSWMSGYDLPVDELSPFIFICSLSLLTLIVGAIDLFGLPGIAFPALIMICGMAVANLPYEYLPVFWQKYVYPWEPLRILADGIREIIYRGGDWWNQYAQNMLWLVVIGLCFMILFVLKNMKGKKEKDAVLE